MGLYSCWVLVMQSFAFSFCLSKVRSLIEWWLRSFCVQRENPMLRILNSLSSCCDVDMLLQGNSVALCLFSTQSVTTKSCTPSCKYRWVTSVLFLTGLFQHLFRLVVHCLSFRRSVFGTATGVLLDNIARD